LPLADRLIPVLAPFLKPPIDDQFVAVAVMLKNS
jgi:hypothetical protein